MVQHHYIISKELLLQSFDNDEDQQLIQNFTEDREKEKGVVSKVKNIGAFEGIDRIYYINLDNRTDKRDFMESWLKPFSQQYSILYQRVSAKSWDDSCNDIHKSDEAMKRCRGVMGLRNSNLHIMDHYNTTGYTLVLEDDFQIQNYTRLLDGLKKVPEDWDVIRFDCWGKRRNLFPQYGFGFRTITSNGRKNYCGGTHATLWRSDRLHKLRKTWEYPKQRYLGIDCLLADDDIKSYCLQAKIGHLFRKNFTTDIPKREEIRPKTNDKR
jgi:hypothetical protein